MLLVIPCLESDALCQESAILGLMSWSAAFDQTLEMAEVEEIEERVLRQGSGAWSALRAFRLKVV